MQVKCNLHIKSLRRKLNEDDTYLLPEVSEQPQYLQAILRNPPTPYFVNQVPTNTLKYPPTHPPTLIKIKTKYTEIDIS